MGGLKRRMTEFFTVGCDVCGTKMKSNLCKINCPNCGYMMDCSDHSIHMPQKYEHEQSEKYSTNIKGT